MLATSWSPLINKFPHKQTLEETSDSWLQPLQDEESQQEGAEPHQLKAEEKQLR